MQESQAFNHLLHVALDLIWSEPDFRVVEQTVEIILAVLKDQVDGALLPVIIRRFGCDDLLQLDLPRNKSRCRVGCERFFSCQVEATYWVGWVRCMGGQASRATELRGWR